MTEEELERIEKLDLEAENDQYAAAVFEGEAPSMVRELLAEVRRLRAEHEPIAGRAATDLFVGPPDGNALFAEARAEEREACARDVESFLPTWGGLGPMPADLHEQKMLIEDIALAIRNREMA